MQSLLLELTTPLPRDLCGIIAKYSPYKKTIWVYREEFKYRRYWVVGYNNKKKAQEKFLERIKEHIKNCDDPNDHIGGKELEKYMRECKNSIHEVGKPCKEDYNKEDEFDKKGYDCDYEEYLDNQFNSIDNSIYPYICEDCNKKWRKKYTIPKIFYCGECYDFNRIEVKKEIINMDSDIAYDLDIYV